MKILWSICLLLLFQPLSAQNFKLAGSVTSQYSLQHGKTDHEKSISTRIDGLNYKFGIGVKGNVSKDFILELYLNAFSHKLSKFAGRFSFPNQVPFSEAAYVYNQSRIINLGPEILLKYSKYNLEPFVSVFLSRDIYDQTKFVAYDATEIIDSGMPSAFRLEENTGLRSQLTLGFSYKLLSNQHFNLFVSPVYSLDLKLKNSYLPENKLYSSMGLSLSMALN